MKLIIITLLVTLSQLLAQVNVLDVELVINKRTFLCYEHVYAQVIIKNRGSREVRLQNDGGNWLDFKIKRNSAKDILMAKNFGFQACVVPANGQVARKVVLTHLYPLVEPGNYTIRAQVNPPGVEMNPISSRPQFFDVFNGMDVYKQQHGVKSKGGKIVEYRVKKMNTPKGTQLYFQTFDPRKHVIGVTYPIGNYAGLHEIQATADSDGYLHVLFPTDAKLYQYAKFEDAGKILEQKVIKVAARGNPMLVKSTKGLVGVRNGLEFDVKKEAAKKLSIHNISQRPPFSYR